MSTTEGKSDRELLALAAKAIALEIEFPITRSGEPYPCRKSDMLPWNPLTDDGDALRLAVKLKIIVTFVGGCDDSQVSAGPRLGPFESEPLPIIHFLDQQAQDTAATRRAIVRAAAEIGSAK